MPVPTGDGYPLRPFLQTRQAGRKLIFLNPCRLEYETAPRIHPVSASGRDPAPEPTEVVAIDGPSGAGKSTIAKAVAQRLGFRHLDTGAMYRAVTRRFLDAGCAPSPDGGDSQSKLPGMQAALAGMRMELTAGRVHVDGFDVTDVLRTKDVESRVSAVAALPFVREAMKALQREVAAASPIVAEGRDMTTVVFPQARWKVFLTATAEERARRRCAEFRQRGREVSYATVLAEIVERDRFDTTRKDAPLFHHPSAQLVDSTAMTTEQVVQRILDLVREGKQASRA